MAMVVRITDAEWVSMRALASMGVYRSVFGFVAVAAMVLCGLTDIAAVGEQAPERKQVQRNVEPAVDGAATSRVSARGVDAQLGGLDQRIARIQETANWGFVTRDFIQKIESRQAELKGVPISVSGIIRDDRQQPVHGAFIVLRLRSNSSLLHGVHGRAVQDVFAVAWTDAEGKFHFHQQPTPWFEPAYPLAWEICVFASGFATAVRTYEFLDQRDRFEEIELVRESVIEGTIKDVEGNPVTHIRFAHVDTVNPYDASLDLTLLFSEMMHYVRPDRDGRIRIGGLPPQRIANLIPEPTANRLVAHIATSSDLDPDRVIAEGRPRSNIVHPYINSPYLSLSKVA